jgi:hypothetical protein
MFLSSVRVPSFLARAGRTDTFASQRKLPCSRLPSLTPANISTSRSALEVLGRLGGRAQIRLADDLDERRARAVEVDERRPAADAVQVLAGVLLHVDAEDAPPAPASVVSMSSSPPRERQLVLADLVALRQIGVEVVLPREHARCRARAAEREPARDGHRAPPRVEHGQRARQAEAHRAVCVFGGSPKRGARRRRCGSRRTASSA